MAPEPEFRPDDILETIGDTPSSARGRTWKRWVAAAGAMMLILAAVLIYGKNGTDHSRTYKTQGVKRGDLIVTVSATGTLEPTNQVDVGTELSGIVQTVEVDYNDRVKRGQALARLDTSKLDAQVMQSRASLESARAKVLEARATVTETQNELDRLRQVSELSNNKVPSKHALDAAAGALQRALAAEAVAKAQVSQAEATLEAIETDMSKMIIRSSTLAQIELSAVTKIYGTGQATMQALRGIDFRIKPGEFVAAMGPSGSGKSTCMNILGCLDTPSTGTYLFGGIEVGRLSREKRALLRRHYLGFVFQGYNLLNRTSALKNVELPLFYRGIPSHERRRLAFQALAAVGLNGWEGHTPSELSGGQQQRVSIARAVVTRPRVLLADEPTGNLDTVRSREIMDLLTSFNRDRGITIVMVTHEKDMAAYAGRIIRFLDGRIDHETDEQGDD